MLGLLSILFGLFGIFTLGLVFVPLAAAFGLFGLFSKENPLPSIAGLFLAAVGFVMSPSLWIMAAGLLGGAAIATLPHEPTCPAGEYAHGNECVTNGWHSVGRGKQCPDGQHASEAFSNKCVKDGHHATVGGATCQDGWHSIGPDSCVQDGWHSVGGGRQCLDGQHASEDSRGGCVQDGWHSVGGGKTCPVGYDPIPGTDRCAKSKND